MSDLLKAPLTPEETASLEAYESRIERGLQTWIEVGICLMEIRDKRLYRASYDTFTDYCQERWEFRRRRADTLIQCAAEWMEIEKALPQPANEHQDAQNGPKVPNGPALNPLVPRHDRAIQELLKTPKRQRQEVFEAAVRMAHNHAPERAHIAAARQMIAPPADPVSDPPPSDPPKVKPPLARINHSYYSPEHGGFYQHYITGPDGSKFYIHIRERDLIAIKARGLAKKETA